MCTPSYLVLKFLTMCRQHHIKDSKRFTVLFLCYRFFSKGTHNNDGEQVPLFSKIQQYHHFCKQRYDDGHVMYLFVNALLNQ